MTLLGYIYKAEGKTVHYNSTETDITAPGGIYRKAQPNAKIFEYIDIIAKELSLPKNSQNWDKKHIEVINNEILSEKHSSNIDAAVKEFYIDFNKGAHLTKFTKRVQVAMFSLYANSPKNAWKSVQSAINKFHQNGLINYKVQVVDGAPGKTTFDGLEKVKEICIKRTSTELLFESYMLLEMSQQYAILAVKNPGKYLIYLNGWNNRMENLAEFI